MSHESAVGVLSRLSARSLGVFRGAAAVAVGVSRKQLTALMAAGVLTREHTDTYRMTVVARSSEQALRAALLWAGDDAAAAGRSAGEMCRLEGVRSRRPEIVVPRSRRLCDPGVIVHTTDDRASLMVRTVKGLRITGTEATLVALAHSLEPEEFEIACEDARRRGLPSVPALQSYLNRFGRSGRLGARGLRELLSELDPKYPSRSTLEVKTRRLLVANGLCDFEREFPLAWKGRVYRFDFAFRAQTTIIETNGRRWHDDPTDYEFDHEKWSVPGRHGYRVVLSTWAKVTRTPAALLEELRATLAG